MSILIKNAWIVTQNEKREILQGNIYIEESKIVEIGDVNEEAEYVLNASGKIVMPGLINTHTHVGMTDMRGMADDVNLEEFLMKMWKEEAKRGREEIYKGAKLGIKEMLRTGTTAFVDMYSDEDAIAKAAKELGIRAFLGWAVVDEDITTQEGNPLNNAENFIKEFRNEELITPLIAPHAVYTCNEETLLKAKEIAEKYDTLITMHISETRKEVYEHRKRTGMRPVEWLEKIEFLNSKLIAAHLVWLTLHEIKILAKNGVKASHNPTSNMKLGNGGSMPLPEMLDNGILVTLGTDSTVSNNNLDMFEAMKFAALLHKNERWDASITNAQEILDFATINAAKALELNAGSIEEGRLADLVILNPAPNGLPLRKNTIVSNIVYSLTGLNVEHTIVNGKIVI
ncbi:amidohydrolase family protein [Candidatus Aciduliprofundum boonei]|uniref:Amidohydrolase n=1 Tax=Aciduliprofundum boonei (strain DSM 19572 / T469) TaxID=439481 RepID=B5IAM2_ACIB4|nr:amidohydrolase family protein [Candidatus Aciduliprofundum boonei]ADD08618.1 amidohydrolase [Aciduliprofundum boonei T469]EDY36822.1 Amidohydrolase family, putative [Aciduliprofundum boonei T469]HII54827.1 amidohydrolase family protein [Candidatus Aciduliprofundum boonei]